MSKLLIAEPPLQVLPSLAVAIGLNEAVIVQQVHYWITGKSGKVIDGQRWIYNGYKEWREQFPFWSEDTIQRAFRSAENQGVIVSAHQKGFDRRKLYRIDYEALDALLLSSNTASCGDGEEQVADITTPQDAVMLTETTEITSETTHLPRKERAARAPEKPHRTLTPLQEEQKRLETLFSELTGHPIPPGKAATIWHITTAAWIKAANGRSEEVMRRAITEHGKLSIKGPQSVDYKFYELMAGKTSETPEL